MQGTTTLSLQFCLSLSGDAEATAAISVGIEHHIPWNQRQQRQLLYRVQWWKEVAQIHLYLPVSFPYNISLCFVCLFL